jgi:hypothetical protein
MTIRIGALGESDPLFAACAFVRIPLAEAILCQASQANDW